MPIPSLSLSPPRDLNIGIMLAGRVEELDFGFQLSVDSSILLSGQKSSVPSVLPLSIRIAATRAMMLEKEVWLYDNL